MKVLLLITEESHFSLDLHSKSPQLENVFFFAGTRLD